MAGHSKWKNIQHRKGRQDAKRSKEFTKAAKEIIIAAKDGADPEYNSRLRAAIAAAKAVNLPKDRIDMAVRKGTGEEAGGEYFEITYEAYGPGGIAFLVQTATDNKNRTVAEIRHIFSRHGGSMGESGCVGWMFDCKGRLALSCELTEDAVLEVGLETAAEDIIANDADWEIITPMQELDAVRQAFASAGMEALEVELTMIPQTTIDVDSVAGQKLLRLVDALEDNDDVQNVYANFELPDDFVPED